ncbi:colicin D domain-containing protein [Actinorugispora endophytica]|uniref:colicin D domain-containing protein n=1 Tax=Actinorugispora endophytica TaxID=1605990 RepID=UPI00105D80E9|nr:colicin D domain-containing protein [Actinorugispora endophytica]
MSITEYSAVIVLVAAIVAALSNTGITTTITTSLYSGVNRVLGDGNALPDGDAAAGDPAREPLPAASVGPDGEVTYSGDSRSPEQDQRNEFRLAFNGGIAPEDVDPDDLVNENDVVIPDDHAAADDEGKPWWLSLLDALDGSAGILERFAEALGTSVSNDIQGMIDSLTTNPVDSVLGLVDTIVNDPVGLLFSDELRDTWAEGDWPAIIGHGLWEIGSWLIPGAGAVMKVLKFLGKGPDAPGRPPDTESGGGPNTDSEDVEGGEDQPDEGNGADEGDRNSESTPCAGNSFPPGTLVLLADGTHTPIEAVMVGDEVWATDPTTGESGPREVTRLITGSGEKTLVEITVTDDTGTTGRVTATAAHPFWLPDRRRWADAIDLAPGDRLHTSTGARVRITATESRPATDQQVHNLTVDGLHTYHVAVGQVDVLAHNNGCGVTYTDKQLQKKFKHAQDFGISGDYSRAKADEFREALDNHIDSPGTVQIQGTYHREPVTHFLDPNTGLNVITTRSGEFISGWKLSPGQLANVQQHGGL